MTAITSERARIRIGMVIELLCSALDQVLRSCRNVLRKGCVIQNDGNRRWSEPTFPCHVFDGYHSPIPYQKPLSMSRFILPPFADHAPSNWAAQHTRPRLPALHMFTSRINCMDDTTPTQDLDDERGRCRRMRRVALDAVSGRRRAGRAFEPRLLERLGL